MLGLSLSLAGIQAGLTRLNVASHNIANATTPGFKSSRVDQVSLAGGGTAVGSVRVNFSPGPLSLDEGRFSIALQGDGFFQIQTPQGPRYTRAGSFHVDGAGNLVTSEGYPPAPGFQVPATAESLTVSTDGQVSAVSEGQVQPLGRLSVVRFANPGGLAQQGGNLFAATAASGAPVADSASSFVFGAMEASNVDLTGEIVGLIVSKASVKANLAALKAQDETLGEIIDLRG